RAEEGGERATLAQLEQRSRAFYALLEHGERERAAATWPGLEADLARFQAGLQGRLDRMRDEVIERDGDLEELFRSPRFREPEVMSLVAAYHLAWVRYHGAQLTGDAAKKRALLQKAVEGFSQFLLVNEVPEIYADSLYGRGLAFLELGDTAKAIEDLSAAADTPQVGAKARAALEEARRRASGRKGSAEEDPEALLARLGDLLPRTTAGDAAVEKDATALARGLAARGGPWPARVSSLVAEKLGGGAPAGVHSTYGLFLLAQLAVDRGRCGDVPPFADARAATASAPGPSTARWARAPSPRARASATSSAGSSRWAKATRGARRCWPRSAPSCTTPPTRGSARAPRSSAPSWPRAPPRPTRARWSSCSTASSSATPTRRTSTRAPSSSASRRASRAGGSRRPPATSTRSSRCAPARPSGAARSRAWAASSPRVPSARRPPSRRPRSPWRARSTPSSRPA